MADTTDDGGVIPGSICPIQNGMLPKQNPITREIELVAATGLCNRRCQFYVTERSECALKVAAVALVGIAESLRSRT